MSEVGCKKILIVEADRVTRMEISGHIKSRRPDWLIFEAENGYQAMEIADQEKLDFFTIDYYLPGITGLGLIIELRRMHTTGKFALLTSALPDHLKTEIEVLAIQHLDKPVEEGTILTLLKYFES